MRISVVIVSIATFAEIVFASPRLINGRPADPSKFKASVWTRSCSATVVGPEVVFIAAHCVEQNKNISFTAGANQYSASCKISSDYFGNNTADYALCVTNRKVDGIPYEKVNMDPNRLRVGDEVLLTGYGCVRPGGGGGNDGTYRIGESRISRMPSGSNNDIVTQTGAALCFGDSGGPAFHYDSSGNRVVISTNSRGNISTTSYLSATHTRDGREFFEQWANETGKRICGLHSDAPGCLGDTDPGPGPQPNSEFTLDYPIAVVKVSIKKDFEKFLLNLRTSLIRAINEVDYPDF